MSKPYFPLDAILILCQPYSSNPTHAVERAMKIVYKLRGQGYEVFSPVLHTHFYDLYWKAERTHHTDDYYKWDFAIYKALNPKCLLFTYDWEQSHGCGLEMKWALRNNINFVVLMEKFEYGEVYIDQKCDKYA